MVHLPFVRRDRNLSKVMGSGRTTRCFFCATRGTPGGTCVVPNNVPLDSDVAAA